MPNTSKGKTRTQHESDMRTALLDATELLFAEQGSAGFNNRAIATRAGTTTQPIYTFFGDQDTLVEAMFDRAIAGFSEILKTSASAETTAAGRATLWMTCALLYRSYCLQYPGRFRLIREAGTADGPDTASLRSELLDRLTDLSEPETSEPTEFLRDRLSLAISALNGAIVAEQEGLLPPDRAEQLFRELVERLSVPYDDVCRFLDNAPEA